MQALLETGKIAALTETPLQMGGDNATTTDDRSV
jgi:hypothetical protein